MAKMTKAELDEIVKQSLPGYKVSGKSHVAGELASDAGLTDAGAAGIDARHLEELRKKYLGADFVDDDPSDEFLNADFANGPVANIADDDDELIVALEPETSSDPLDRGSRAKVAVLKEGKESYRRAGLVVTPRRIAHKGETRRWEVLFPLCVSPVVFLVD